MTIVYRELICLSEAIRILEVVNVMDRAGIETFLMNHYRRFDRSCVQMDFLTHRSASGDYDEEILSLGGHIYRAPRLYPQNWLAYRRWMDGFFANHDYPVIHSHIDAMSYFPLAAARANGVAVRVAHSHSDSVERDLKYPIKEICRKKLPKVATDYWACSEASGDFLFGEASHDKIRVIRNAIDLERFKFDRRLRMVKRNEIAVEENQILIGHVGRFSAVKNQSFLVRLLGEFVRNGIDAILAFVGDGESRQKIESEVIKANLADRVRFLGSRDDVNELEQAFDLMVFPSFHEGIPLALIEAQASGLPVLASSEVSDEALVSSNCSSLPLTASFSEWVAKACELIDDGRDARSVEALMKSGYEIKRNAEDLMRLYVDLWGESKARLTK